MVAAVPFGRWPSPLGARQAGAGRRSRAALHSDGEALYWVEGRPEEDGRQVVVRAAIDGTTTEVLPPGSSARSRVHEYGGGPFCLVAGEHPGVAFVEQADQRVRLVASTGEPQLLGTPPPGGERWAHGDLRATPDGRFVLCVRERHGERISRELVAYPTAAGSEGVVLCAGRDFYAAPRPDPEGRRLAWTCWDHPDMPWDASEVWVAELVAGPSPALVAAHRIDGGRSAGNGDAVSVGQPVWETRGRLVYVSDRHGWWQPWCWDATTGRRPLTADEAEYHGPDWALGQATLAVLGDGTLVCRRRHDGEDTLVVLDPATGRLRSIDQPCVSITAVCVHGDRPAWLGATPTLPSGPWSNPPAGPSPVVPPTAVLRTEDVSVAEPFRAVGADGRPIHGLFHAPRLGGVSGPAGELPPLLVHCHGGPTGSAEPGFDPVVQFFTTRGFAVAVVDYAGSAGYGRAHRQALAGRWGQADADDCVDAARWLARTGRIDGRRMAIRGSSAGGFTALCALCRSDAFVAAATWYAVTDLLSLAGATHDFERHYTDRLVGPLPEAADQYRRRSPVHRTSEVHGSVLLLQGLDDPVVPPSQATAMADALTARGRRCELLTFPGEGHGFRRAETVERCLEAELAFYRDELWRS